MRIVITLISLYCALGLALESGQDYLTLLVTGGIDLNLIHIIRLLLAFLFLLGAIVSFFEPVLASLIFLAMVILVPISIFAGITELNICGFPFLLTIFSYFCPKIRWKRQDIRNDIPLNDSAQYLRPISGYKTFIDSQLNYFKTKIT